MSTIPVPFSDKRNDESQPLVACLFCGEEIKHEETLVHMLTSLELTTDAEHEDSQGYFPVGPHCAKKVPSEYLFPACKP